MWFQTMLAQAGGVVSGGAGGSAGDAAGRDLISQAVQFLTQRGVDLAINVASAIAIFVVGRWCARLLTRLVEAIAQKSRVEETLVRFLCNLTYALVLAFVGLAAINRLGIDTTSLAAVIAAAGLAVGFALQGSLSNFAAGIMLIVFKPFRVGDSIEAGGTSGVVEEIQIFNTLMCTGDNVRIIVPNSSITGATITNHSAKPTRRVDLVFSCGYEDDLLAVKRYLEEVLAGDARILKEPAPVVAVNELAASSVDFVVRPWVKSPDYWAVRWDLLQKIKLGFDERGFNIPYPTQTIRVEGGAAPERKVLLEKRWILDEAMGTPSGLVSAATERLPASSL